MYAARVAKANAKDFEGLRTRPGEPLGVHQESPSARWNPKWEKWCNTRCLRNCRSCEAAEVTRTESGIRASGRADEKRGRNC